jgi:CO/xanthine dehydrogenase FAD-binding subunit
LRGQPVKAEALREAAEKAKRAVDPISDFRGSAAYKKEMAAVFVRRALENALADLRRKAKAKTKPRRRTSRRKKR